MTKYVDADAAIKSLTAGLTLANFCRYPKNEKLEKYIEITEALIAKLRDLPAVEGMQRTIYGKWITTEVGNLKCSICGDEPVFESGRAMNFCPNCGARIQHESEEENDETTRE